MEGMYPVSFGGSVVGKVQVKRQGLYYHFDCRCRLSGDVICRLQVRCKNHKENLGIVAPDGEGFALFTRLPVKRIGEGDLTFLLVPKYDRAEKTFAPIYPDEPFAYISRLKKAYLVRQNGQAGIYI